MSAKAKREIRKLILPALVGIGVGTAACGGRVAARPRASDAVAVQAASPAAQQAGGLMDDGDDDGPGATLRMHNGNGADSDDDSSGNSYYDGDDENVLDYGHAANETDTRAIAVAVKRYYALATRGDGASVCKLLTAKMARSVVEVYGNAPSLPALHGKTCAVVTAKLLLQQHGQMSADDATVKIGVVRVAGAAGEVLLSFDSAWPNSYLVLQREHRAWKMGALFAEGLP
jgi:hypothetical protein